MGTCVCTHGCHVCSDVCVCARVCMSIMAPSKVVYSLSSKDQDKTRPLSTLANLAIIITDVQDMDPIFINLPYSTNIYEHSPPVRRSLVLMGLPSELLLGMGALFGWTGSSLAFLTPFNPCACPCWVS